MQCMAVSAARGHQRMRTYRAIHRHALFIRMKKPNRLCHVYISILAHICPEFPTHSCTYTRRHPRQRVRSRAHTCARASAVPSPQVPRRTEPRPSAHTWYNEVSDAMFHAPRFALNPFADANTCEPSRTRSTPAESARAVRRGYTCAEAQAGTRTHTCTHMCARMVRRHASLIRSSM